MFHPVCGRPHQRLPTINYNVLTHSSMGLPCRRHTWHAGPLTGDGVSDGWSRPKTDLPQLLRDERCDKKLPIDAALLSHSAACSLGLIRFHLSHSRERLNFFFSEWAVKSGTSVFSNLSKATFNLHKYFLIGSQKRTDEVINNCQLQDTKISLQT